MQYTQSSALTGGVRNWFCCSLASVSALQKPHLLLYFVHTHSLFHNALAKLLICLLAARARLRSIATRLGRLTAASEARFKPLEIKLCGRRRLSAKRAYVLTFAACAFLLLCAQPLVWVGGLQSKPLGGWSWHLSRFLGCCPAPRSYSLNPPW